MNRNAQPLQTIEEIEVPPCATELTVGDHVQAAGALLFDHLADRVIFHRAKLPGINLTAGKLLASLFDGIRA